MSESNPVVMVSAGARRLNHSVAGEHSAPHMTIALLGIPVSSGNQGVQALAASLVNLCVGSSEQVRVCVMTGNSKPTTASYQIAGGRVEVPVTNYRLTPKAQLREHLAWIVLMAFLYRHIPSMWFRRSVSRATPWIASLEACAFAGDVRGGDSFSDLYGLKRFIIGGLAAWTALLVKGTMVQFPQTYGPFKSPLARWMARYLLRRSLVIVARDKTSQQVAQAMASTSQVVLISPDVAFSLVATHPRYVSLDGGRSETLPSATIGINVNGLIYHGGYTRKNMFGLQMNYPEFLNKLLNALLQQHTGEIWLVPHTYAPAGEVESDLEASYQLRNSLPLKLQERIRIIEAEYDPHEIKGAIGMCDFFIGSRMHSCIAALSQGVPCVGVAYSMKFQGVFESVGMGHWVVDGRAIGTDEAVRRIIELYHTRDDVRGILRTKGEAARSRLVEVFDEIMQRVGLEKSTRIS